MTTPTCLSETLRVGVPVFLLVLVNCIFSGYVVLTAEALHGGTTSPVVFAFLRDLGACAILLPTCYIVSPQFWPKQEHWGHFIVLGVLGVWGAQLLSSMALDNLSAINYGLMTPTVPVVTTFFSLMLGLDVFRIRTVASWAKIGGILVTVGGAVALVAYSPNTGAASGAKDIVAGNAYLVLQKLCAGTYPILQKFMLNKFGYPSLTLAAWAYTLGTIFIGMNVMTSAVEAADWSINTQAGLSILYSAVLSSAFNYFTMAWVNKRTSPLLVMAFYPLQAFLTPVLSYLFLDKDIYVSDVICGSAIVVGLSLCVWAKFAELPPHPHSSDGEVSGSEYSSLKLGAGGGSSSDGVSVSMMSGAYGGGTNSLELTTLDASLLRNRDDGEEGGSLDPLGSPARKGKGYGSAL